MGYLRKLTWQKTIELLNGQGLVEVDRNQFEVVVRGQIQGVVREVRVPISEIRTEDLMSIAERAGIGPGVFETLFEPRFYRDRAAHHLAWLKCFGASLAEQFSRRLDGDPDAAVFEVLSRELLERQVDEIRPGEASG